MCTVAAVKFPGTLCGFGLVPTIDPGTMCRHVSVAPGQISGISLWPEIHFPDFLPAAFGLDEAITEFDKAEFAVVKTMPVFDSRRRPFKSVNQYVANRTLYFGPPSTYREFAADSDAELQNTEWPRKKAKNQTLRSMIEFDRAGQARQQQIFYRWVRKAYQKRYGDDVDVPELIRKGMSQKLADRIAEVRGTVRVKKVHDEAFHAGGFNPRPIKFAHHYLLGTLSEHATGMAVDIDDKQNAQLTAEEWRFIEGLVGVKVNRSGRWNSEAAAEGLWNDIAKVNKLFVDKVAAEVKRVQTERAAKEKAAKEKPAAGAPTPGAAPAPAAAPAHAAASHPAAKAAKQATPLQEVLGKHSDSLSPWATTGFFHLPLELVLELHAHGFTWGATFSTNVDLHHFELDE
jgi:hypothetical protein